MRNTPVSKTAVSGAFERAAVDAFARGVLEGLTEGGTAGSTVSSDAMVEADKVMSVRAAPAAPRHLSDESVVQRSNAYRTRTHETLRSSITYFNANQELASATNASAAIHSLLAHLDDAALVCRAHCPKQARRPCRHSKRPEMLHIGG